MTTRLTTERYEYYHLAPKFYARVKEDDAMEVFNFKNCSWNKVGNQLARSILTDGDSITLEKINAVVSKNFSSKL